MKSTIETVYVLTRHVFGLDMSHDRPRDIGKYVVWPMDRLFHRLLCVVDDFGDLVAVERE